MMRYFLLLPVALFAFTNCKPTDERANDARIFKNLLTQSIREADEIKIVEHSNPLDHPDIDVQLEYRSSTLDELQTGDLAHLVEDTPPEGLTAFSACFIPHHSVQFFKSGQLINELEVCLECGGVRLTNSPVSPPQKMFNSISNFLGELGYHRATGEEWNSRASRRLGISAPADIPAQPQPPQAAEDQ